MLEQFARFGKGFDAAIFDLAQRPANDPLFPYASGQFGSGANMALRAEFARSIRGFDPHLGTGTPSHGGEDLDLCIRVLMAGGRIAYEPAAIVFHQHPDGAQRLRRQAFRYGVGLSAMLTKQLTVGAHRRDLLRAVPAGVRYLRNPASPKHAAKHHDFPVSLERLERLGMACGPLAYLKSRVTRAAPAPPRAN
jgi:GT2 family glycosyltransferase